MNAQSDGTVMDTGQMPENFPTNLHDKEFWEWLGRLVATFGYLEVVLKKAIYYFQTSRPYPEKEIDEAYQTWELKFQSVLSGTLTKLVDAYQVAVIAHPEASPGTGFPAVLEDLRRVAKLRNALCHANWPPPDENGASLPYVLDRKLNEFATPVDVAYLKKSQQEVAWLANEVGSTLTSMGMILPGTNSSGTSLAPDRQSKSLIPNPKSLHEQAQP